MQKILLYKVIYLVLFIILSNSIFALNASSNNFLAESQSKPVQESAVYYSKLAQDYQARADFYRGMAKIYESVPLLAFPESNIYVINPYQCSSNLPFVITECKYPLVEPPKYNPWKSTQFSFGGGGTTGNDSTSNAQGNLVINYKPSESDVGWNFNILGQYNYLYSGNSGVQKNRLYLQQNSYYMFNKYNGIFGQVSYLNDAFDGYYYTWNENIGYQLQLFKTDKQNLLLSVGPGLQQRQVQASTAQTQMFPTWMTQVTYNLSVNDVITFTEQLQNIASSVNTSNFSISTLTIQAYKNIGIGLNYQLTTNSSPEPGTSGVSTISGVTFVYSLN